MASSPHLAAWRAAARKAKLDDAEARFMKGDRAGLWLAIIASAAGREPLPEWARQGLHLALRRLSEGKAADLNEVLGWNNRKGAHKTKRAADARYRRLAPEILLRLMHYRQAGRSFTAVELEEIGEAFGVSRYTVQRVYEEHKAKVSAIVPHSPGTISGAVFVADYWEWDDAPRVEIPWLIDEMLADAKQKTLPAPGTVKRKRKTSA